MRYLLRPMIPTLAAALVVTACSESTSEAHPEPPTQTETEQASESEAAPSADKRAALASYERIRASLAKDAVAAVTADAESLASAARTIAASRESGAQAWAGVADAAKTLHGMSKKDADAVRKAFGEVSRHVVDALRSDAEAAKGLHVFECPMAQGYKKWVQPSPQIENPYMGTRMLECGSKSSL